MHRALRVGWSGEPDGRCRTAELLMRDGRPAQAAPIGAQVRADTPNDGWLSNSAGREYPDIGDHEEALTWLTRGVQIAMTTQDPGTSLSQAPHQPRRRPPPTTNEPGTGFLTCSDAK
jgi:hypothetical protein